MRKFNARQQQIRRRLATQGRLNAAQLAAQLKVTTVTIRRDLTEMERAGLLIRTHGGCLLQSPFVTEASFPDKQRRRQAQKTAIANAAARLLRKGDTVYLDTGTTALAVARALPPDLNLKIFTNNLRVAMELFGRAGVEVTVYGGMLARKSPDLVNEMALAQITQYRLNVAIVGGDALDVARGEFYSADTASAALSRAAQRQADRLIVVMDSSKFGKRGLAVTCRLARGVTLVTDSEVNGEDHATLHQTGAAIICVETHESTRTETSRRGFPKTPEDRHTAL
jgi:DeoR family transcriptional regulator, aga operon transcriptional repressor